MPKTELHDATSILRPKTSSFKPLNVKVRLENLFAGYGVHGMRPLSIIDYQNHHYVLLLVVALHWNQSDTRYGLRSSFQSMAAAIVIKDFKTLSLIRYHLSSSLFTT